MKYFDDDYSEDDFPGDDEYGDGEMEFGNNEYDGNAITVHERIGYIYFPPAELLDRDHLTEEYERLTEALEKSNVNIHFLHAYPLKEKYRFITEEIFNEELFDCYGGGMDTNYIYEEFYNDIDYFNSCFLK